MRRIELSEFRDDDVLDELLQRSEDLSMTEGTTSVSADNYYTWGADDDVFTWDFFTWG